MFAVKHGQAHRAEVLAGSCLAGRASGAHPGGGPAAPGAGMASWGTAHYSGRLEQQSGEQAARHAAPLQPSGRTTRSVPPELCVRKRTA